MRDKIYPKRITNVIATNVIEKVNPIVGSILSNHHFGEPVENAHAMKYVNNANAGKNASRNGGMLAFQHLNQNAGKC